MKELRWSRTMLTSPRAVRKISHSSRPAEQGLIAFPNWLLEKSGVGAPLTLRHPWRPWTSFRVGWVFSSLRVCLRHKSRIAARIAGPVIILCALPGFASAQDATWSAQAPPTLTRRPTGHRQPSRPERRLSTTRGRKRLRSLRTPLSTPCNSMRRIICSNSLNAVDTIAITGVGIQVADPANAPTFNVSFPDLEFRNSSTAGPAILNAFNTGPIAFLDTSNAGTATINAGLAASNSVTDPNGFTGGFVFFRGNSTAADAKITTFWASNIEFQDTSKAGNATITAPVNGGSIFFENASSADHATITMQDGTGELSFAPGFFGGGTATAGNATIINSGRTNFFQGSTAGNATITTNAGGVTSFFGESTGGNATFITNTGGIVDISGLGHFS